MTRDDLIDKEVAEKLSKEVVSYLIEQITKKMKEIRIKIYGWSDLKKWFWDKICFPRRMLVVQWLTYYNEQMRSYTEELLLKYNNKDLEKDDYAILSKAMKDWDKESRKICDKTVKLIMKKE